MFQGKNPGFYTATVRMQVFAHNNNARPAQSEQSAFGDSARRSATAKGSGFTILKYQQTYESSGQRGSRVTFYSTRQSLISTDKD